MSAGDSLSEQLQRAISECQMCVFIATRRSIESQWCLAEVGAFWGSGKNVTLFMVDPDLDDSVLPPQFKGSLRVSKPQDLIDQIKQKFIKETNILNAIPNSVCKRILSRKQLYIESRILIENSNTIHDTTWGRRSEDMSLEEKAERESYRASIGKFLAEGKSYRELLTAEKRIEYLQDSLMMKEKFPSFQCRVLGLDISTLAIMDLIIADRNRVLFAHVSSDDPTASVKYLVVHSEPLAELFLQFYSDAWRISQNLTDYCRERSIEMRTEQLDKIDTNEYES